MSERRQTAAEVIGRALDSKAVSPISLIHDLAWAGYVIVNQAEMLAQLDEIRKLGADALKQLSDMRADK